MINTMTNEPLKVETGGTPIHSLDLPYSQVDEVKRRLDAEGIDYWVWSHVFIWEDNPPVAHISFHPKMDPKRIQKILDHDPPDGNLHDLESAEASEKAEKTGSEQNGVKERAMINAMTNEPLKFEKGESVYHSMHLPVSQLDEVKKRLDEAGIEYWQMGNFKWEDQPWVTTIVLYPKFDPQKAQAAIDGDLVRG